MSLKKKVHVARRTVGNIENRQYENNGFSANLN